MIFVVLLFSDRKLVLEYAVAFTSDYRLSIDGPFSFGTEDGIGSITLGDATLYSALDGQTLLTVGRLELVADFGVFSLTSANIQKLRADNVVATVIKNDDETLNWPVPTPEKNQQEEGERDWDIVLGNIQLSNVRLSLDGFTDRAQQLHITSLNLSENLKPRIIESKARLNDLPIAVYGELYDLSAFVLDEQPLRLSLNTTIDNFRAGLVGVFSNSDTSTDLRLSISADNMKRLTDVFSEDFPDLGELSLSGQLLNQEDGYQLRDIEVEVDGRGLQLQMNGRVEHLLDDPALAGTVNVSSPDIGRFEILNTLAGRDLSGLQVDIAGHVSYLDQQAIFADLAVSANDKQQDVSVSAANLRLKFAGDNTVVDASSAVLAYQIKEDNPTAAEPWAYQYNADQLYAEIQQDFSAVIKTNGEYKGLPVSAGGEWKQDNSYRFDVVLDQAVAVIEGFLRDDQFQIVGRLVTPSLKPLAQLLDEKPLPITQGEIVIAVDINGADVVLSQLDLTLTNQSSSITVSGQADDLLTFDDYRLDVAVTAESLKHLDRWVSQHGEIVERSIDAFGDTRTYASSGDVNYRRAQAEVSPWLQDVMQALELDSWIKEYPALDAKTDLTMILTGRDDDLKIDINTLTLRSALAAVDWSGSLRDDGEQFSMQGNLTAVLQPGAVDEIVTSASLAAGTAQKDDGPITLSSMQIVAGNTELTGNLELDMADSLKKISGNLDFKVLDILPYTSSIEVADKQSNPPASPGGESFFSDEPYPLAWLPEYDVDLSITAEQWATPWFDARQLKLEVLYQDDVFTLNPVSFMVGQGALGGNFALDNSLAITAASLKLEADSLDPDLMSLLRDYNLMKSGSVNVRVDVTATGKTEKALASSLDGQMSLYTINSLLNGRDLADLAPEVLTQVNQKVNPFYKKPEEGEDTELQCAALHFDVQQGVMTADKSIILVTPDIVFGANGAIDLGKERLRMQIIPRVRRGLGISLRGTAAKMAVINGPMTAPVVEFDPKGALTSAGRDVAGTVLYGPIYWIYMGQAEKLLASSSSCTKLITRVEQRFNQ
ncbi:hypothetical protein BST96_09960 [Oceanicoccus sagamiensis]|uniref:AsmA domain-containing protein n=1 Tax=Oceanicoccus sagamiensis TaxID=716816 RepID=A0A1X9NHN4_9GAMM|nr:hypothetical protein BST96_09960 [Oceanicoccus sagamiensis]